MSEAYYSELKAAWHLDRIQALRYGNPPKPIEIQLILSDLCNHDCHFCAYRASNGLSSELFGVKGDDGTVNMNPSRMIERDKAFEIIRDAATLGAKSIIFTGGGEPTVHPNHMEAFRLALDLGLECSLNTNGAILRPGWDEILPRFKYVRVSVDAGTPSEYAEIRKVKPTVYNQVLRNISLIASAVKKNGCAIGAGYVVTPKNHVNLVQGVSSLRDTGIEYVRLASMQSTDGPEAYTGEEWRECLAAIEDAKSLETDSFKVVDLFQRAMGKKMVSPRCHFQQIVYYIGADLTVYRCCYTAYTAQGIVGTLSDKRLTDYFADKSIEHAYTSFDARSCATCPMASKNEIIAYMADSKPPHVNFV